MDVIYNRIIYNVSVLIAYPKSQFNTDSTTRIYNNDKVIDILDVTSIQKAIAEL